MDAHRRFDALPQLPPRLLLLTSRVRGVSPDPGVLHTDHARDEVRIALNDVVRGWTSQEARALCKKLFIHLRCKHAELLIAVDNTSAKVTATAFCRVMRDCMVPNLHRGWPFVVHQTPGTTCGKRSSMLVGRAAARRRRIRSREPARRVGVGVHQAGAGLTHYPGSAVDDHGLYCHSNH